MGLVKDIVDDFTEGARGSHVGSPEPQPGDRALDAGGRAELLELLAQDQRTDAARTVSGDDEEKRMPTSGESVAWPQGPSLEKRARAAQVRRKALPGTLAVHTTLGDENVHEFYVK